MNMSSHEWLTVVKKEYLQDYIKQGGSSVKFAVVDEEMVPHTLCEDLETLATTEGFVVVHTDARKTKVHLIDLLFHEVARQINWDDLAHQFLIRILIENGCQVSESQTSCCWSTLASLNGREEADLRREVNSWLEKALYRDFHMSLEYRLAMMQLCLAQLEPEGRAVPLAESIKQWLRGDIRQLSAVKEALIFQKVSRSNARHMFASLAHWIRLVGKGGLVVSMDISPFMKTKRSTDTPSSLSYSASTIMDAYEMLRQFIDGTDDIEGMLLAVVAPQEFLSDQRLGLNRYEALKLRIWDDVRDKFRQNPFAPMVRLSGDESSNGKKSSPKNSKPQMTETGDMGNRRVIESLRSGVPSTEAVRTLGCPQPAVKGKFQQLLHNAKDSIVNGWTTKGMLIEGGFGTGKSHLLESLQHLALEQNFICSKVVISKETPLYSPSLMFRAAIESAVIPGKRGEVLTEVARDVNFKSPSYSEFYEWVHRHGGEVDGRFAAALFLFERMVNDPELSHRMIRFWAGDPFSDGEIRRYLKACDSTTTYRFDKVTAQEMALQRFKFASRLMVAAGYSGWILLIDEAEIIGRYSFKQRAQSYAELARWMGRLEASSFADLGYKSGLASVMALTDDFQSAILDEKGDREKVPSKLRETGSETDLVLARQAEQGMRLIECERIPLVGPYDQMVEEIYHKIRSVHGTAYEWDPPHVPSIERLSSTRIREYVKGWITEWDLKRLAPEQSVEIELTELKQDYSEDLELEIPAEESSLPVMAESR